MQMTYKKLNTLDERVEFCLERYPTTRNGDITLFATLCNEFYPPFERPLMNWKDLAGAMYSVPDLGSIARARRKVIERNKYKKYLPTIESIARHRGISQVMWRQYALDNPKDVEHKRRQPEVPQYEF